MFGQALLAFLLTVTCLTTAVGLVAAFAQDFHKHFPKVSYHAWLALSCLASFLTANFGLDQIIAWSTPLLCQHWATWWLHFQALLVKVVLA